MQGESRPGHVRRRRLLLPFQRRRPLAPARGLPCLQNWGRRSDGNLRGACRPPKSCRLSRECEAASGSTTPGWHHPAILSTQSSGCCILHLASSNEALPHGTLDHRVNNFVGGQGVSLDDFIRIFRCDGAVGYALVGFVLFSIACEVNSRMRGWDSYRSRFLFVVYGTVGFLIGGGVYLISQGHCTASAPVVAALSPI